MCKNMFQNKYLKGDIDMNTAVNIDVALGELIKNNKDKIKSITPKNPALKKDDEWRNENEWDELYKELTDK